MEKPINIGKLNKRIAFLQLDEDGQDAMGQATQNWKASKLVWATFRPIRGSERDEAARKFREERTYKATIRYQEGITTDMRIMYKSRIFEIKSVVNVNEANYMLEIECTEYVDKEVQRYEQ